MKSSYKFMQGAFFYAQKALKTTQGFLLVLRAFAHIFIYYNVAYEVRTSCIIVIPFKIKKHL